MDDLVERVARELLPVGPGRAEIESLDPREPVVVRAVPAPWTVVGTGNYAAVLAHPDFPDVVVKLYAPGRPGHADEVEVYRKLGAHPAYSELLASGDGWLLLRRLHGTTLFDALRAGTPIPPSAIADVDRALDDARARGLFPHDVHAKNVMVDPHGRGLVVDVSDFGHRVPCARWDDLKRAYRWIYVPLLLRRPVPIPLWLLDGVRRAYRWWRRMTGKPD